MSPLISVLTAVLTTMIALLLGLILKRLSVIDSKLDLTVDEKTCLERSGKCQNARREKTNELHQEDEELWSAFHKHSHTGLPTDAQVIRR